MLIISKTIKKNSWKTFIRRPNYKDRITQTGDFSWKTTEKLKNSKIINKKDKRSYEETVQQEKAKFSRVETRKQHVVGSKEYSIKVTFKEAEPKKI